MALREEVIQIRVQVQKDELARLKAEFEAASQWVLALKDAKDQGLITDAQYTAGLQRQEAALRDVEKATKKAEAAVKDLNGELSDTAKKGAQARVGLAGLNIAQDMAQGGWTSGINNVLGMMGDKGIMGMGQGLVAAAGGWGVMAAAAAGFAVVAGGAFVIINEGLQRAELGWGDFLSVLSNLGPLDQISGWWDSFAHTSIGSTLIEGLKYCWELLAGFVGFVADWTIGWGEATEAAKKHKQEIEASAKAMKEYAEAVKSLDKFKSTQQEDKEKSGKLTGTAVAELGGAKGVNAVVDAIAPLLRLGKNADDKVKVHEKDKEGNITEKEITVAEKAKIDATTLIDKARTDEQELEKLFKYLAKAGYTKQQIQGVREAFGGYDVEAENKADQKESDRRSKETKRKRAAAEKKAREEDERETDKINAEDQRESDRRSKKTKADREKKRTEAAKGLQDRFNEAVGEGKTVRQGEVASELLASGAAKNPQDAAEMAAKVFPKLIKAYEEEIQKHAQEKGMSFDEAAVDYAKIQAKKKTDKAEQADKKEERAREEEQRDRMDHAKRIGEGTGVDTRVKDALLRSGMNMAKVQDAYAAELQAAGMSEYDATVAAATKVQEIGGKTMDEAYKTAAEGPGKDMRAPQTLAMQDLSRTIQDSQDPKDLLDTTKNMEEHLAELVRQGGQPRRFALGR